MNGVVVKRKGTLIDLLFYITSIVSILICLFSLFDIKMAQGFGFITYLPVVFLFFSIILLPQAKVSNRSGKITLYVFLCIQWLRLVVLPLTGVLSGYFNSYGSHVDESSAQMAVLMLIYEAVISFVFCYIFFKYSRRIIPATINGMNLRGNTIVYIGFIIVSILLFLATDTNKYHFFALSLSDERVATTLGNEGSAIDAIIAYGLTFLVILILYYSYKRYVVYKNKRYMYLALLCAAIRLCLISSEGRMTQIYLLGTFLMLLPQLFPDYKSKIIRYIIIMAIAVLGMMTVYKVFYAFLYDSYAEAIRASSFGLYDLATQIDIYFYGIKTVARNIGFCKQSDLTIFHSIYDLLRNTFGLHYVIRGTEYSTVEYYNLYIYSGKSVSGHLFSSLAYGYLYFGALFAPICTCFNLFVSFWTEKMVNRVRSMDIYYITCLLFVRISLSVFSNYVQTWNVVSRTLTIGMLVIGCSSLFTRRNGRH